LILSAKVTRARGYVQKDEQTKTPNPDSKTRIKRAIMSEFVLSEVKLTKTSQPKELVFESDFGWSILDEGEIRDPKKAAWDVLGRSMRATFDQLEKAIRNADLSGGFVARKSVRFDEFAQADNAFGAFESKVPATWLAGDSVKTATAPTGWKSDRCDCLQLRLRARQTWRFHRVLGPYQPEVVLWSCIARDVFKYDVKSEHPAEFLGQTPSRRLLFLRALGETNWKSVREDVRRHLNVEKPKNRYLFQVGGLD
jgi:hypothetical protein